ncbi:glycosyltransferase [Wenyingzhuangia sp. chi5]|uniref:Glycosyltransferase n=1 Tax=Wenyingzhuangia gilva TaxID=3057677 RepID=A0ABT8VT37_9FLAO|nr:glycosyltransferase [Wenyingzhuangia sp. chi5]MDO3695137.1 glycosyltransferase [Wenyingzhuangia sp. chi5]
MIKPLNVIQIIDSLAVGGAEMMAVNIANGLPKYGITSHLCVTRAEGLLKEKISKEVGTVFLNKQGVIDVKALLMLKNYIKKHKIKIIHAHSSSFFIAVLVKFMMPKIKIVWHDHYGKAEEIKQRKSLALKFGSLFFTNIISVNEILVHWAKKELYCKKVLFLANFANLNTTSNKTHLNGIEGKRIVCVAAFRPQKDHFNLLQAFTVVKNKYPDWTLHLIGQKHDNIYAKQIENIVKNEKLENEVYLYGSCLDVKYILSQSTIGVLSSNSEGLPVSLLEYGLSGLPVVVTNVGDCKKVVNNYGLVVPKENSMELATSLETYIQDENLRKLKGTQFQKHIFESYSESAYFSKLLKTYKAC